MNESRLLKYGKNIQRLEHDDHEPYHNCKEITAVLGTNIGSSRLYIVGGFNVHRSF